MRLIRLQTVVAALAALTLPSCGGGSGGPTIDIIGTPDVISDSGVQPDESTADVNIPEVPTLDEGADAGQDPDSGCAEGTPCDDGDPCTWGEACNAVGVCAGGTTYTCDDGRNCTTDTCDGQGNCEFVLMDGHCLISGICRSADEVDSGNECQVCLPDSSLDSWSSVAAPDVSCDPTALLGLCDTATSGTCQEGFCVADDLAPRDCGDGNPCTDDSCNPNTGCQNVPVTGSVCFLTSACEAGACNQGVCVVPTGSGCDDGNPCTEDTCDVNGCVNTPLEGGGCEDDDACTLETACVQGVCQGLEVNCNDGDICTLDGCDAITGCFHDTDDNECCQSGVSICDDDNQCTDDGCSPVTLECEYEFNDASCDDGNPCTVVDSCSNGDCLGTLKDCNDGNQCTLDSCADGTCINEVQNGVSCDDGLECSIGDHCENGTCVADESGCVCEPIFADVVSKFTYMLIADTGHPGEGLDLDGDPGTCAPSTDCSAGIDNSLGPLGGIGTADILKGIEEGEILILYEHKGFNTNGAPYTMAVYAARKLDPTNAGCDFQVSDCKYLVDEDSLDEDCNPIVALDNAMLNGNQLTAGGPGYTFPFELPLFGDVSLEITLFSATVEATATVSGGEITELEGILAGAVPKTQLKTAIENLPPEVEDQLPFPKEQIITLLELLVQPDIDGNNDGIKESASIGIQFTAIPGQITGVD